VTSVESTLHVVVVAFYIYINTVSSFSMTMSP